MSNKGVMFSRKEWKEWMRYIYWHVNRLVQFWLLSSTKQTQSAFYYPTSIPKQVLIHQQRSIPKYPMIFTVSSDDNSQQPTANSPNSPGSSGRRNGNFVGHRRHLDVFVFISPLYSILSGCPLAVERKETITLELAIAEQSRNNCSPSVTTTANSCRNHNTQKALILPLDDAPSS